MKDAIADAELQLIRAIKNSDVQTLDQLIHNDTVFSDQAGQVISKASDLELHRSGKLIVERMEPSEQHIRILENVAIISVRQEVAGSYDGAPFSGSFRYLRIWKKMNGRLQVIAASCTAIGI